MTGISDGINQWKEMECEVKEMLESVLLRLLKEADDVRQQGVQWILHKLHSLHCVYHVNDFPTQLDEQSK